METGINKSSRTKKGKVREQKSLMNIHEQPEQPRHTSNK